MSIPVTNCLSTPIPTAPMSYPNMTYKLQEPISDPNMDLPIKYSLDDDDKRNKIRVKSEPNQDNSQETLNYDYNSSPRVVYEPDPVTGIPRPMQYPQTSPTHNQPTLNAEGYPIAHQPQIATEEEDYEKVFIWDLDETLIILHSLTNGTYAQRFAQNPSIAVQLGLRMEEIVLQVAEMNLFWRELDDCDQVHVDDIQADELTNNQNIQVNAEIQQHQELAAYNFMQAQQQGQVTGSSVVPPVSTTGLVVLDGMEAQQAAVQAQLTMNNPQINPPVSAVVPQLSQTIPQSSTGVFS